MPSDAASRFFTPPPDHWWRWAADGGAVEAADGTTLSLWVELHPLLHQLAPQGLPPFGAVLLVLSACGKRHSAVLASLRGLATRAATRRRLQAAAQVLETIAALPEELRSGPTARLHLITVIFEGPECFLSPAASLEILAGTVAGGMEKFRRHAPGDEPILPPAQDLKAFTAYHARHDLTQLENRLRTGLEAALLQPARVPVPDHFFDAAAPSLLRQLAESGDHGLTALAALGRRVVAMLALPRPAGYPGELPVGGVSGLTNHGPLDRLLPGELAADEDILLARLAQEEALYFRRETPPQHPARQRVILLDSGIHLWGLPRLYALAAALGLQATAGREMAPVRRREGPVFQPLALATVADVQACLQALQPDPNAAVALENFHPDPLAAFGQDVFFLTAPGTGRPVQQALHGLACRLGAAGGRLHVLTLSRTGALELSRRTQAGSRLLSTGWIDPDEILRDPARPAGPAPEALTDLPALIRRLRFYQLFPLPFRFPAVPLRPARDFPWEEGRVNVDTKWRLMHWSGTSRQGAGEIASGIPRAPDYHIGRHGEEWVVLCAGSQPGQPAKLLCLGAVQPTRREVVLESSRAFPLWMKCWNGAVVLGYAAEAGACSLTDGRQLDRLILPEDAGPDKVVFDGQRLGLATAPPGPPPVRLPVREIPPGPALLAAPVSAGFVASGTLVIRAQGGRWELTLPEFILTSSHKSQLAAVRPFRRVPSSGTGPHAGLVLYLAEWHPDCRLVFDARGLLHLLFTDHHGPVELTLLCLLEKPVPAWVAHWPQPQAGPVPWMWQPARAELPSTSLLTPYLQRFTAAAWAAPVV